jgi:hypothetical protein
LIDAPGSDSCQSLLVAGEVQPVGREAAIHLDTTVMLEQFKAEPRPSKVERNLEKFKFRSTSTYARYEYNRTWVKDMAYLYARAGQVAGIHELYGEIGRSFQGGQKNRMTRCLEILEKRLGEVPQTVSLGDALLRLREHISLAILNSQAYWDRRVHHHFERTGCVRASIKPRREASGLIIFAVPHCKRSDIRCKINEFFISERQTFITVKSAIDRLGDKASDQCKQASVELAKAVSDPERLCEDKNCAQLGDVLIAVDSGKVTTLAANNDKDWIPIANALDKQLINPCR